MALYGLSGTLVLGNGENPVGLEVFQFEARAAGPLNGEGIHNVTRAQPEVLAALVAGIRVQPVTGLQCLGWRKGSHAWSPRRLAPQRWGRSCCSLRPLF